MYGIQTPRLETAVGDYRSVGSAYVDLSNAYHLNLDPWQAHCLENGLQVNKGKWVNTTNGISVPRQAGKTAILEARALGGVLLSDEKFIAVSAHEVRTTLEIFRRIKGYFENYDDLRRKVKRIALRAGDEYIELKTGQRIKFMSRSKNAGRGFTADALLLDESQELSDDTWAAILPTITAAPNAQVWLFGTPPAPVNNGEVFKRVRKDGLAGSEGVYYAEWSADPELDYDDQSGWAQANPALGYRVEFDTIRDFRGRLSDDQFAREILGIWSGSTTKAVIDADTWGSLATEEALDGEAPIYLAVDVSPERDVTSVSLAQPKDDGTVGLVLLDRRNSVTWAIDYIAELCGRRNVVAVAVDSVGAGSGLIEPLKGRMVPVITLGVNDVKAACGRFYDAVMESNVSHYNDVALNSAVGGARKRSLGDAWAWNKRDGQTDITPLVSATYAHWATYQKAPVENKKPKVAVSNQMYGFN
jgi:hypothetical protein